MLELVAKSLLLGDQKAETAAIAELAITIKADSPELGEKVNQALFVFSNVPTST